MIGTANLITAEEVVRALGGKWYGDHGVARCPCHDDENPSLSVKPDPERGFLAKCHARCPQEEVFKACVNAVLAQPGQATKVVPLAARRAPQPAKPSPAASVPSSARSPREWWAEYCGVPFKFVENLPLADEGNELGFTWPGFSVRKLRKVGQKSFQWAPPGEPTPPLWPVPTGAETLLLTEGESDATVGRYVLRDVENCEVLAVTKGGSAGVDSGLLQELKGCGTKRLVVVGDADETGREFAKRWQEAARKCGLQALALDLVKLGLVSPSRGEKDLRDALPRHREEDLREKILSAIKAQAPSAYEGPRLYSAAEVLEWCGEEVRWVVDGLLLEGGLSVWAARPKAGKSTLSRALAVAVAQGREFLGRPVRQGEVLLLSFEDPKEVVKQCLARLGMQGGDPIYTATEATLEDAVRWIRERRPTLAIVDTLARLVRIRDYADYGEVTAALGPLLGVARETQAHVAILHHAPKGSDDRDPVDAPLGSTAIAGTVDTIVHLKRGRDGERILSSTQRVGQDMPETVVRLDETFWPEAVGTRRDLEIAEVERQVLEALGDAEGGLSRKDLSKRVEAKTERLGEALRRLVETGGVLRTGSGRRGDPYVYHLAENSFPNFFPSTGKRGNEFAGEEKTAEFRGLSESNSFPGLRETNSIPGNESAAATRGAEEKADGAGQTGAGSQGSVLDTDASSGSEAGDPQEGYPGPVNGDDPEEILI